jgi:hypothetical protein
MMMMMMMMMIVIITTKGNYTGSFPHKMGGTAVCVGIIVGSREVPGR